MSADVAQPERSSRGSAWALGGLLALVLGCCVAGGLVAVLREGGKSGEVAAAGSAADGAREEPASVDGPFHYAAVRRTREAAPAVSDVVLRVTPTERAARFRFTFEQRGDKAVHDLIGKAFHELDSPSSA